MKCTFKSVFLAQVNFSGWLRLALIVSLLVLCAPSVRAAIVYWSGGIATATFFGPSQESVRIGSLNASGGGSYTLNESGLPEFRLEFNGVDPEMPRMVNTNFVPIAVSDELGGEGLRQFTLGDEIGPTVGITWGAQGFMDDPADTTIWNSSSQGYAGFRVGNATTYNYGWALLDYKDETDQIELIAFAMESEVNTPILAGAVPEPSVAALGLGALLVAVTRRRRGTMA